MGNILYSKQVEKGVINYFAGSIAKLTPPKSVGHPYRVSIRISVNDPDTKKWVKRTLVLSAWNNDNGRKMADIVMNMKLKEGTYIYGICREINELTTKDGKNVYLAANLLFLSFSGKTDIEDGDKSYVLLSGNVGDNKPHEKGGNISLAISTYNWETKEKGTVWYNVNMDEKVYGRIGSKVKKGNRITVLAQHKNTKKETKNPVVQALRVDVEAPGNNSK